MKKTLFYLLLIFHFSTWNLTAQEVPKVLHFSKQQYGGQNQNWSITQDKDLQMYIGNAQGLLQYNGSQWHTLQIPNQQIIRTTYCDTKGNLFIGGFGMFGYWQATTDGKYHYISLVERIVEHRIHEEEIWHIFEHQQNIYAQSFSMIYRFDYYSNTVTALKPPSNIMFARTLNQKLIVPVLTKGLYELNTQNTFEQVPNGDFFQDKKVATIQPTANKDSYLVGTQYSGIFQSKNGNFHSWTLPINDLLKQYQLNKGIRLQNGDYAWGTIRNGVYITDSTGNIRYHLNQQNALQNNTILSLFEDAMGNLWVGLDKGIDLIVLDSPMVYSHDKNGQIGTVYTAVLFEGDLYIGTNQGLFYRNWQSENNENFQLIEGSQGQVWDLKVIDGQLICGHNLGTFLIEKHRLQPISIVTGGYNILRHPDFEDILLQGTYTGLVVYKKDEKDKWTFSNRIANFQISSKQISFDKNGWLWIVHPQKGLFRGKLNKPFSQLTNTKIFSTQDGLPSLFHLSLINFEEQIVVKSDSLFMTFNEETQKFEVIASMSHTDLDVGNYEFIKGKHLDRFKIFPHSIIYYNEKDSLQLHLSLVPTHENIVLLNDSTYLFCMDDGYGLLYPENYSFTKTETVAIHSLKPMITQLQINGNPPSFNAIDKLPQPMIFKSSENHLQFQFAVPHYAYSAKLRYRLRGFEDKWSTWDTQSSKEFTNLNKGDYVFEVQSELSNQVTSFAFEIEARWYQTLWAKFFYLGIFIALFYMLLQWHERRLKNQKRELEIKRKRELHRQRIEAYNERLQIENENKTRQLADSTMNLVRKNEILIQLKHKLKNFKTDQNGKTNKVEVNKSLRLIDEHISSEEDWAVFESHFNQLHGEFFKRLKTEYPDLTPGDLRLAAYLKMNLSSKEIAPLLNISLRGVENKRYRLRQKMDLDSNTNLTAMMIQY